MNPDEAETDALAIKPQLTKPALEGEWGWLKEEPCRYCRQIGGVYFLIDDGPEGRLGQRITRCNNCKRTWQMAPNA